jgi:hypothetical protein
MLRRLRDWWNFRQAVHDASRVDLTHPAGERDVVVLPCWRRPEFLWHCLDNLTRADGIDSVHLLFRPDTGFSPDNLDVIRSFSDRLSSFEIQPADPCPFRRTKPSANFLLGMLHAAATTRRLVFLVEEDIMVARDFFRWHRAVHAAADPLFCSIPVKNPNRVLSLSDDPAAYYLSSGDSCSNGMCFDKQVLQSLVAPHVNMAYLRAPKKYIRRNFPASTIGLGYVEQDGLIRRIQERSPLPIAWPCVPRAFHSGFFGARGGWHNFTHPAGAGQSIEQRVQLLTDTIYDADAMLKAVVRNSGERAEFIASCLPCSLTPPAWNVLHRIDVPPPQSGVSLPALSQPVAGAS